jgi:hypothetical protein
VAAIDQAMVSKILNSTTSNTAFTTLTTGFKMRLNSTLSTASASGTELTVSGYTAGGSAVTFTTSSAGSAVTTPHAGAVSWVNGSGGSWSIASLDILDGGATRTWWGPFTGQPISVANGNTFQVAQDAVSISLT